MRAKIAILLAFGVALGCGEDSPTEPAAQGVKTLSFARQQPILTSGQPVSVIAGDFNGDTKTDLVVSYGDSSKIDCYPGNGDGTFGPPIRSAIHTRVFDLEAGDLDGDGMPDVGGQGASTPSVLLAFGNGTGSFVEASPAGTTGGTQGGHAIGSANGDGLADFVRLKVDTVEAFLGDPSRAPVVVRGYRPPKPASAGSITSVLDDFDGDGKADFVMPRISADQVAIYYGYGDGTFQPPVMLGAPNLVQGMCALRPLGRATGRDFAISDAAGNVCVYRWSNGTYLPFVPYAAGSVPHDVASGDFDGDGLEDLAVDCAGANSVAILLGKADGTFLPARLFNLGGELYRMAVADLNGDSRPDVVSTGLGGIYILLNTTQ